MASWPYQPWRIVVPKSLTLSGYNGFPVKIMLRPNQNPDVKKTPASMARPRASTFRTERVRAAIAPRRARARAGGE